MRAADLSGVGNRMKGFTGSGLTHLRSLRAKAGLCLHSGRIKARLINRALFILQLKFYIYNHSQINCFPLGMRGNVRAPDVDVDQVSAKVKDASVRPSQRMELGFRDYQS